MTRFRQYEMTASQWAAQNPVLLKGEVGWETPLAGQPAKAKKGDGVTAWNSLAYSVTPAAPLDSPVFTGDPRVPTALAADNDTTIANTAFVKAAIASLIAGSPALLDTLDELAQALGDDPNFAATMATALATKAPLASPSFTGDPKAPTPAASDNDTSIATTAHVKGALVANDALWTPNKRRVGTLTDCVIVGSSNAITSTWGPEFCATWGLNHRNFAVGGSGFVSSNNFLSQLQAAAADTSFANASVAVVVICDASNNIREWNDTGNTRSVASEANTAFAYARATFPNARVVCVPVVWPSDPQANVASVPGGFQKAWLVGLTTIVDQLQVAAAVNNVEMVDWSWTWLTGLSGVMASDGSVHPNAAGYTLVAQWISRHLRGESTRKDTAWAAVPYTNAVAISGQPPLRWRREGWTVFVNGTFQNTTAGSGGLTDFAALPAGIRPANGWELSARQNGASASSAVQVYTNGTMRLWTALAANSQYFVSGVLSLA